MDLVENLSGRNCDISEVGGVKPKVPPTGKSSSEFDVFALSRFAYATRDVRDVRGAPCERRRACDRSIGRDWSEGPEIGLRLRRFGRIFLLLPLLLLRHTRLASGGHCHLLLACSLHMSNGILTIPGGHGKDIEPLC